MQDTICQLRDFGMTKQANKLRDLVEANDKLRDEVEYHKADAKKWALQALKFDKWQPISTAPKDGTYIMVGNDDGVWVASHMAIYPSGFAAPNPWHSLMLNHRHMEKKNRGYSSVPTHWMPLPEAPNDRVEGRDAALSRRVPSHDGLCGNGNYNERTDK